MKLEILCQIFLRRISQSEIRNSAAAENEGGQKFLPPNPLPFCPPERSFRFCRASRGNGSISFKKSSRKVYNYSTSSNLFGIKNMERFCGSQNRALIFAKTLSAYGGSREIP